MAIREQFLAMTVLDIRPSGDADLLRDLVASNDRNAATDRIWRHIRADGSEIDVSAYCQFLQYEGHAAWMVALIDITERQRANAELRRTRQFLDTVIENVPAMLFVKEASEHRYVLMNRAGEELLGIPSEELIGKSDYDFMAGGSGFASSCATRKCCAPTGSDRRGKRSDPPQWRAHVVTNGWRSTAKTANQILLGVAEDITDRKRAVDASRI